MTFGIKPNLLNKAQQFLNQSNGLPSMKIVTNTKEQPKTKGNKGSKQINNRKQEPKKTVYSKGVVDTNGANEIQFKEMFNFNLNNITDFKPILNKKRNSSGKAILTFSTCVPPLKTHGKDQEKEINPLLLNPTRCNACQLHGHHTTKCRSKKIRCTFCSGAHASRDCHVDFHYWPYICFHCSKNPNLNSNHSANHPMCPTWIKYKQGINEQNNVIRQEWEQRKNENRQTKLPPSIFPSQSPPSFGTTDNIPTHPPSAPTFAQTVSTVRKPAPVQTPTLNLPPAAQSIDLSSRGNRIMQVNEVAAILKFLLSPANLTAIQVMDETKRNDYIDRLVSAPHAFTEKDMHQNKPASDNNPRVDVTLNDCTPEPPVETTSMSEGCNDASLTEVCETKQNCSAIPATHTEIAKPDVSSLLLRNSTHRTWDRNLIAVSATPGRKTRATPNGRKVNTGGSNQRQGHMMRRLLNSKDKKLKTMTVADRGVDLPPPVLSRKGQQPPKH